MEDDELYAQILNMSSSALAAEIERCEDLQEIADPGWRAFLYAALKNAVLYEAVENGHVHDKKVDEQHYKNQIIQIKRLAKSLNYDSGLAHFFLSRKDLLDEVKPRQRLILEFFEWRNMTVGEKQDYVRRFINNELSRLEEAAGISGHPVKVVFSSDPSAPLGVFRADKEGLEEIEINDRNLELALLAIDTGAHETFHCFLHRLGLLPEEHCKALPENLRQAAELQALKIDFGGNVNSSLPSVYADDPEEKYANGYAEYTKNLYVVSAKLISQIVKEKAATHGTEPTADTSSSLEPAP